MSPNNYINTVHSTSFSTQPTTHTQNKPMAHNCTHTGKPFRVQREKRWALRADLNDAMEEECQRVG